MMMATDSRRRRPREVLVWHRRFVAEPDWVEDLGRAINDDGLVLSRTHSARDTIGRVERGGLAGAIVAGGYAGSASAGIDGPEMEGAGFDCAGMDSLDVMRSIRAIDADLPCWLVARRLSRPVMQTALQLRVVSVFTYPVEVSSFCLALQRVLEEPENG